MERAQRAQGGEERQTGYVVVLWAGSRKGNSPERPAWEWVSISDSVSRAPTLFPSPCPSPSLPSLPSPLFTAAFLFDLPPYFSPSLSPPSLSSPGGVKKSFLMGFSQIVFTDISEIFRCKENIWTYFSLIGSLMAILCLCCPRRQLLCKCRILITVLCSKKIKNQENYKFVHM